MQSCQVCGRSFDPLEFQVVVPELERGFDRIDCARSARTMASPGSRFAAAPILALATPAAPVAFAARSSRAPRLLGSTAATLGLLAAGTAAAALLWVHVVGTDTSSYTLGRITAPPAFGDDRVQAQIQAAPASPGLEVPTVTVERVVTVPEPTLAPSELLRSSTGTSGPDRLSRPPVSASRPAKETGREHPKIGLGHRKHGEDDGIHSPGHGKSPGKGSKAEETADAERGPGKGKGHH
jgi:hypothetical protein